MAGELRVLKVERKPQLHATVLESKCMEAVRRRYIEKEIIPPGVSQVVGTGTHRSIDANLNHKMQTGELLPVDAVADAARDGVNDAWDREGVKFEPEELELGIKAVKGNAVDKAVRLAKVHHKDCAPVIQPIAVERGWSLEIPGYPMDLVGRIDIQEADAIRDTKTAAKTPPTDCAEKSLQLKAYALAVKAIDGKAPSIVQLDYLIDTSTPKSASFQYGPDDSDYRAVLARLEIVALAMEKGVFVPVEPSHWCCCPRYCGYALTCRYYTGKPKQFTVT